MFLVIAKVISLLTMSKEIFGVCSVGIGYPGIDSQVSYFRTGVLGIDGKLRSRLRPQRRAVGLSLILIHVKFEVIQATVWI